MYRKYVKRLLDIIISVLFLPLVGLISLIIIPLIWINDRGPIFYNAPRLGKNGHIFIMYKFRSMVLNSPQILGSDGSTFIGKNDKRITRIGQHLRKTSLDEIPQFINVLKGDMSLVGPRPNLATGLYIEFDEIRKKRLKVRPGITGYNQAYYRNSIPQDQKFSNDCYYVDNLSFLFDLRIIFKTITTVFLGRNINNTFEEKSMDSYR